MNVIVITGGSDYEPGDVLAVYPEALRDQAEEFEAQKSAELDWVSSDTLPLSGVAGHSVT
ncbi:hypothetical protein [Streptomyces malaysiensis]